MEASIRQSLKNLILPKTTLLALDLLEHIQIDQNKVLLIFTLPDDFKTADKDWEEFIRNTCEKACSLPVVITFHRHQAQQALSTSGIQGVHHVIAIASGKGGVGKSSICLNLALAAQSLGLKVGILDADIYGPSLPTMTNIFEKPNVTAEKKLIPHQAFGIKLMSMGFMIPKDAAVIWRGLMVQSAISQMLGDVLWNHDNKEIDILFIDLPPGTGDAQLTIAQKANLSGAIITTTSQELALIDARRAIKMFEKVHTPILGIIENMSHFHCPGCGLHSHIFPKDGTHKESLEKQLPLLGAIPLDIAFRESADKGKPFFITYSSHPISNTLINIANQLKMKVMHA